jgi:hypothetical protein
MGSGEQRRRLGRRLAWWLVVAGGLVMAYGAIATGPYRPDLVDPDPACLVRGECSPAEIESALRALWWVVGAGGVLALIGVALATWLMPTTTRPARSARLPVLVHAGSAGALVTLVPLVLAVPGLIVLLWGGTHAVPLLLAAVWLAQAGVVTWLDGLAGRPAGTPRRAWMTGLGASAAGIGAAAWLFLGDRAFFLPWWAYVLVDGAALALAVLLGRLVTDPVGGRPGDRVRRVAALAGVLGVVGLAVVAVVAAQPGPWPVAVSAPGRGPVPSPPSPPPSSAPGPPSAPSPSAPPPVPAEVPCTHDDLAFDVPGFDAAMGARGASIRATNLGAQPCWVEGVPVVTLLQGGRPLELTVEPGQAPTGGPAVAARVGIAPGGSALALLTWRTYAGWADAETPQAVTVALDAGSPPEPVDVVSGGQPAPFDLADGGAWGIAPWAPPWD